MNRYFFFFLFIFQEKKKTTTTYFHAYPYGRRANGPMQSHWMHRSGNIRYHPSYINFCYLFMRRTVRFIIINVRFVFTRNRYEWTMRFREFYDKISIRSIHVSDNSKVFDAKKIVVFSCCARHCVFETLKAVRIYKL